jgi:hypothetical protein
MRRELAAMLSLATACLHHGPAFCPSRTKVLHRRGGAAMPAASLAWQVWRVLATMLPRTCRLHGPVPCTNQAEIRGRGRHATLRLAWLERRAMVPMSLRACLHHYPASCWGSVPALYRKGRDAIVAVRGWGRDWRSGCRQRTHHRPGDLPQPSYGTALLYSRAGCHAVREASCPSRAG